MDTKNNIREGILKRAEKMLYYNDLLIKQCDSWLSEEEGNINMKKRIEAKWGKELRIKN